MMAYGCRSTCDNCRPKYVACPECGKRNFLVLNNCKSCKAELTAKAKDMAIEEWQRNAATREIKTCYSSMTKQ